MKNFVVNRKKEVPMISVIIPIYNSEKYLKKCIESVINQTYKDIEIILVDDGSRDSSAEICDEYAKKYENVQVLHQMNQGLVQARKKGVSLARGEYIAFVDSDDWIDEDFYEKLIEVVKNEDSDIVTSGIIYEWKDKKSVVVDKIQEGTYYGENIKNIIWEKMIYDKDNRGQGITAAIWNKVFKREKLKAVIENIDSNISYGEDGAVVYTLLTKIDRITITYYCGYHYLQREDSMIHTFSEKSFGKLLKLHKCMKKEMLKMQDSKRLISQIDLYVQSFLQPAIKSVYGISMGTYFYLFPYEKIPKNSKVILYGAGTVGQSYYKCLKNELYASIVCWVDKNYERYDDRIETPYVIRKKIFDYVVIAIEDEDIATEVKKMLINMGVDKNQIIWEKPNQITFLE